MPSGVRMWRNNLRNYGIFYNITAQQGNCKLLFTIKTIPIIFRQTGLRFHVKLFPKFDTLNYFYYCRYIAADDGKIRCAEVRQQLLSGEWAAPSAAAIDASCPPLTVWEMDPIPELDLVITSFAINSSGTLAIAAGPTLTDPEISAVCIIDIASRRPHVSKPATFAKSADLHVTLLDDALFSSHPGLHILQVEWHPHSDRHVAVLTSDATWRLYDTSRPDLAEQIFELHPSTSKRGLGLEVGPSLSAPVAFSFGKGPGWDAFAVYFLTQNGGISVLCPVAPFGARYPSHAIESLQDALDERVLIEADGAETAEAWLQRAFQPVSSFFSSAAASEDVPDLQACRPHALDDHSPALVGPLPVVTAEGTTSGSTATQNFAVSSPAEGFLLWRFAGACTALAVASARGPVGVHLLAGGAAPRFHQTPPQCITEGTELRAVRCQAAALSAHTLINKQQLILIDLVNLRPPLAGSQLSLQEGDEDEGGIGGDGKTARTRGSRRVSLHMDLSTADTMYCVFPGQSYAISLPWLAVLGDYLSNTESGHQRDSSGNRGGLLDTLPSSRAEELGKGRNIHSIVSSTSVGDPLCSSALIILSSDNSVECLRPSAAVFSTSTAGAGAREDASVVTRSRVDADIDAHIQRVYGDLSKEPRVRTFPIVSTSGGLGTPAGTKALADAVAALRESHIVFAHRAHHDLGERLEQLKAEVEAHEDKVQRVSAMVSKAEEQGGKLESGIRRAAWMAENISRRLHLLAELHWALPRPVSEAEVAFKREELPNMEEAARKLGSDVTAISGRISSLQRALKPISAAAAVSAGGAGKSSSLPHSQLRQVRELLAEHDRAIRVAKRQAAVLREALSAAAVGA